VLILIGHGVVLDIVVIVWRDVCELADDPDQVRRDFIICEYYLCTP